MNILQSFAAIAMIAIGFSIGFFQLRAHGQQPSTPPVSGVVQFTPDQAGPGTAPSGESPGILAPGVGSNVQVNQDATGQPQNEPSMTVNPVNSMNLVAGANDYATANGDSGCGFYSSSDGGSTWSSGTPLRGPGFQAAGDPAVAFDSVGNVYYSCLSFNRPLAANEIRVFKSTDGGKTWPTSAQVAAGTGYPSDFHDKEYLAVDTTGGTFNNHIYVTWAHYNDAGVPIKFTKSTDGGVSFSVPTTISDTQNNQFSQPAVGPNGEIYVSWRDFNVDRILLDKSTDGGSTWNALGADQPVALITPMDSINALSRAGTNPSLAVDAGPGRFRGSIYLVWHDGRYGDADVLFSRSTDGGATWSSPTRVNDDFTGNGKDQIFPWVNVGPDGKINIMWYDRRLDPSNRFFHVFFAQSLNGGASFKPNIQVTTIASDPCAQFSCGFIGDYLGMASSLGAAHPLWADMRNGNQDLFTASIDTLQGLPDLVVTSVSGPSAAATGTTVTISNTVCNEGNTTTGVGFNVEFYLSTDEDIKNDGSDRYIGGRSVGILGPGECDARPTNIFIRTIPPWILPGTYYLGAIADGLYNAVEEGNELNNIGLGNQITITPGPDLVMSQVSGPSITNPGNSISISHTVCNQGVGKAGEAPLGFGVGLYLSPDPIIGPGDTSIGTRLVLNLNPGECRPTTSSGQIPSDMASGDYLLGAIADFSDFIQETNETNNALAGNPIRVVLAPTVVTLAASQVMATSATLNGSANPNGTATTGWFEWGTTTSYGNVTPAQSLGSGTAAVAMSHALTGLSPNTTYHFRAVAENVPSQPVRGSDQSFTAPPPLPVVSTGSATDITFTTATLNGTANPNGVAGTAWFEYGFTTSYGSISASQPISGAVANDISIPVTGLTSDTTYHYRIAASNNGGATYGDDATFSTLASQDRVPTSNLRVANAWSAVGCGSGGSVAYRCVDDPIGSSNNGTDYIRVSNNDKEAIFGFSPVIIPQGASINLVRVTYVAVANGETADIKAALRVNSTTYTQTTAQPLSPAWALYHYDWPLNPRTGVGWTVADINGSALQGMGVYSSRGNESVTQVYLTIVYQPPPSPPSTTQDRVPTGNVSVRGAWSTIGCSNSTAYECVDDPIGSPNYGTDYLRANNDPDREAIFGFSPFAVPTGASIQFVRVTYVAVANGGFADIKAALRVNGAFYVQPTAQTLTSTWAPYSADWPVNPATGTAWTAAEVNGAALQGMGVYSGTGDARVTQTYVTVGYQ